MSLAGTRMSLCRLAVLLCCVRCGFSQSEEFELRLVGGESPAEGRLEVRPVAGGAWGTVCDDGWSTAEAVVACRTLGYPYVRAPLLGNYGPGDGPIYLDDVACSGSEQALWQCPAREWGQHNCVHIEDVGVACSETDAREAFKVRLVGGLYPWEGRAEVSNGGAWGTVCDDDWDRYDATVVCRSLGYGSGTTAAGRVFGPGSGPIHLDNVDCLGDEEILMDCPHNGWDQHNCAHYEDAGVICSGPAQNELETIDVRLSPIDGGAVVEVRVDNGTWGTICAGGWELLAATVVCRSLGRRSALQAPRLPAGDTSPSSASPAPLLAEVRCRGDEAGLANCSSRAWDAPAGCGVLGVAGAVCSLDARTDADSLPQIGSVRLVGGATPLEGLVQVYLPDQWGTVCDDGWGEREATVVCRQLGYPAASAWARRADYGALPSCSTVPVLLDGVACSGLEGRLEDCPHAAWGRHDCSHVEDAGVTCSNVIDTNISAPNFPAERERFYRLLGGTSPLEGALQVRSSPNETWNTVCMPGSEEFPYDIALALCRSMGFSAYCGPGSKPPLGGALGLDAYPLKEGRVSPDLSRNFEDRLVTDADHLPTCTTEEVLWLGCDTDLELRLAHGYHASAGLLQLRCIHSEQQWLAVCGDWWRRIPQAHRVACRHLGFATGDATWSGRGFSVPLRALRGPVDVLLGDLLCSGYERVLQDCLNIPRSCLSYAGLECGNEGGEMELRLVYGRNEASGFLQGRAGPDGQWGALCREDWDSRDARVACRHLGFPSSVPLAGMPDEPEGALTGNATFLTALGCRGHEGRLGDCEVVFDSGRNCAGHTPYVECVARTRRFNDTAYLCGGKDYCGAECSQRSPEYLAVTVSCQCDEVCHRYHDCCYDYAPNCEPGADWTAARPRGGASLERYRACASVPMPKATDEMGYALVGRCPEDWRDEAIRSSCELASDPADDVIGALPVQDAEGADYKNIFCALCHGVQLWSLRRWEVSIEYALGFEVYTDTRFNVTMNGRPTGRNLFSPPAGTDVTGRSCPVNTVRTCLDAYRDTALEAACGEYYAPLMVGLGPVYHNPHCAMCNGRTVEPGTNCGNVCLCEDKSVWEFCTPCTNDQPFPFPSIEVVFDFGLDGGGSRDSPCRHGELFDPFSGACRNLACKTGRCSDPASPSLSDVPVLGSDSALSDTCTRLVNASLDGEAVVFWQARPSSDHRSGDDGGAGTASSSPGPGFTVSVLTAAPLATGEPAGRTRCRKYKRMAGPSCDIVSVEVYAVEGASLMARIANCAQWTFSARDVFPAFRSELNVTVFKTCTLPEQRSDETDNTPLPAECIEALSLDCTDTELVGFDDYHMEKGSLVLSADIRKGETLDIGKFVRFQSGQAVVCRFSDGIDPNAWALGTVSLVCSCLSLAALAATFVTYSALSELRNEAGLYIMNLLVALFAATLTTVTAWGAALDGTACSASASLVHLSWTAAFCWTATLAYRAARTFGGGLTVRGLATGRRPLVTAVFVWGTASLIAGVCLGLDLCRCTGLPAVYRRSQPCLMAGPWARLLLLGVPLAGSVALSTVCLVFVAVVVRRARRDSKILKRRPRCEAILADIKIYTKLALLFGTTWLLAFLSDVIDHVVLSYVNVTVNTLQGTFLFLAFGLNGRVRALWRRKFAGGGGAAKVRVGRARTVGVTSVTQQVRFSPGAEAGQELKSAEVRDEETRF